ncbi:MAG: cation diffusion facilitator family transporter [Lentimicrobiaceae bacterium]|jgi:cation diffusion facilitator family transporter
MQKTSLKKFIYLAIAAAIATISLKLLAYFLTGSVGMFSDALESGVNLIAAIVALFMITLAEKPADEEHAFGHHKAEYFSSAIEGGLIVLAAFSIIWSAIPRIIHPQLLENVGIGLLVSFGASLINLAVGLILIKKGRKNNSITLEADGKHLMTDVYTSVGVIIGIGVVKLTGWLVLDGVVAIGVALNIVWTGYQLMRRSALGLLDSSIPEDERLKITKALDFYKEQNLEYHSLMTRQAGQRKFVSFHVLLPGKLTIQEGHDMVEKIERNIRDLFDAPVTVFTHLEPVEDPVSMQDIGIDRRDIVDEIPIIIRKK